jgi:hypothetical protein
MGADKWNNALNNLNSRFPPLMVANRKAHFALLTPAKAQEGQ